MADGSREISPAVRGGTACSQDALARAAVERVGGLPAATAQTGSAPRPGSIAILGAGYVGGELARLALARGWRVSALTRNPAGAAALRALGCGAVVEADIADEGWHTELGGGYSFVVNCTSPGGGGIEGYRRSCVAGMESAGRWLASQTPGTIVCTSSTGVYPQGDGAVVDEDSPTEEGPGRGGLLRLAEQRIEAAASAARWRWFVLRLAGIYGPGRHHLLDSLRAGGPLRGDPAVRLNLIHRDDIVSAVFACLESGGRVRSSTFNLSDNAPHSRAEVAAWLASRLGMPPPRFEAPPQAKGRPSGRRATPDRVVRAARIQAAFGWAPRHGDFRAGYEGILARAIPAAAAATKGAQDAGR